MQTFQCVECDILEQHEVSNAHKGYEVCTECGGLMNLIETHALVDFNGRNQIIKKG